MIKSATELRIFFFLLALSLMPAAGWAAAATPWQKINLNGGALEVPSRIKGIEGWSGISTNTNITLINEGFLKANKLPYESLGETSTINFAGDVNERRYFEDITAELFGQQILFRNPIVGAQREASRQLILGQNFLKDYILQVDYPNQRMRLLTRDSLQMRKLKNVDSRKGPLVKVSLNDEKSVWLEVSTSYGLGIFLEHSVAKEAGWLDRLPVKHYEPEQSGQGFTEFMLPSVTIGPHQLGNVQVIVYSDGNRSRLAQSYRSTGSHLPVRSSAKGLIGYGVLKHFVLTMDGRTGHTHLGLPE